MKYRKEITLKSGESLLLRSLKPQDAQESIWLLKKTAEETLYMMRYEDEWTIRLRRRARHSVICSMRLRR